MEELQQDTDTLSTNRTMEELLQDTDTLSSKFSTAWKNFEAIENSEEPTSSAGYQNKVTCCSEQLVQCTCMVNSLGLFSSNEQLDEVSTANIQFFLLPAFLGELLLKLVPREDRKTNIQNARTYFKDFLKRCRDYKIISRNISKYVSEEEPRGENNNTRDTSSTPVQTREEKIACYKENKNFDAKIQIMRKRLEDQPNTIDDDMTREYHLDWLQLWVNKSIENITFVYKELEMLQFMEQRGGGGNVQPVKPPADRPVMKPILITRDMIQRQVFGSGFGYKNLPTMTDDEYFEKEVREGKIVLDYTPKGQQSNGNAEEAEIKNESEDEEEDEEKLQKARAWDDWKDTHRRGDGNKERNG